MQPWRTRYGKDHLDAAVTGSWESVPEPDCCCGEPDAKLPLVPLPRPALPEADAGSERDSELLVDEDWWLELCEVFDARLIIGSLNKSVSGVVIDASGSRSH